jgi:selenocysteine-specific elongation factor
MSDLRTAFGNTRKHALPLVAVLDGRGVTRRRGDVRIAGPRLPAPPPTE